MKSARILTLTVLLLTAVTVFVHAEDRPYLRANVPFAFTVGNTDLPAGAYQIDFYPQNGSVLIRNQASGKTVIASTRSGEKLTVSGDSKMVFHRTAGHYFLMQLWEEGNSTHRELRPGKLESELLAQNSKVETTTILASAASPKH